MLSHLEEKVSGGYRSNKKKYKICDDLKEKGIILITLHR